MSKFFENYAAKKMFMNFCDRLDENKQSLFMRELKKRLDIKIVEIDSFEFYITKDDVMEIYKKITKTK